MTAYRKLLKTAYKNRMGRGDGRGRGERVSAVFFSVQGDE